MKPQTQPKVKKVKGVNAMCERSIAKGQTFEDSNGVRYRGGLVGKNNYPLVRQR